MAASLAELMSPRPFHLTTFPNDGGYDELIVARSIPLRSLCEHHMLPFVGTAHIGYLPGTRILGLSKLARVLEHFASRPQVQERLTVQVADWLSAQLSPVGVGVVIEAEHLCMTLRGVQAPGNDDHHVEPARGPARRLPIPGRVPRPDPAARLSGIRPPPCTVVADRRGSMRSVQLADCVCRPVAA